MVKVNPKKMAAYEEQVKKLVEVTDQIKNVYNLLTDQEKKLAGVLLLTVNSAWAEMGVSLVLGEESEVAATMENMIMQMAKSKMKKLPPLPELPRKPDSGKPDLTN